MPKFSMHETDDGGARFTIVTPEAEATCAVSGEEALRLGQLLVERFTPAVGLPAAGSVAMGGPAFGSPQIEGY